MKEIGQMMRRMVREFYNILMEISMKEIFKGL